MEIKKLYIVPQIELVELDNQISLALESNPPAGPSETRLLPEQYSTLPTGMA